MTVAAAETAARSRRKGRGERRQARSREHCQQKIREAEDTGTPMDLVATSGDYLRSRLSRLAEIDPGRARRIAEHISRQIVRAAADAEQELTGAKR